MATLTPQQIRSSRTHDIISSAVSDLRASVVATGTRLLTNLYKDIGTELNERKFYIKSPISYEPISPYFTTPMGETSVDAPIAVYYGIASRRKMSRSTNTTPDLLTEPFMDRLSPTYHTIMELHDLHSKRLDYEIIHDEDVVTIYNKIGEYLRHMSSYNLNQKYDVLKLLSSLNKFHIDLTPMYNRVCHRNKWVVDEDNFSRLLDILK